MQVKRNSPPMMLPTVCRPLTETWFYLREKDSFMYATPVVLILSPPLLIRQRPRHAEGNCGFLPTENGLFIANTPSCSTSLGSVLVSVFCLAPPLLSCL